MRILVDADACPVKDIILSVAKQFHIDVVMYFDNSHVYDNDYATVIILDKGHDSVDLYLINEVQKNDIVISQDYGVACLALSKQAHCINQNGMIYNNDNIDSLLMQRAIGQKLRKAKKHTKGPKKRTKENDIIFEQKLKKLIVDCQ